MEIPMILAAGTVVKTAADDGSITDVTVIGAGPADRPDTVLGITMTAPRRYAIVSTAHGMYASELLPPDAPSPYIGDDRVHPPHAGHPGDPAYDASLLCERVTGQCTCWPRSGRWSRRSACSPTNGRTSPRQPSGRRSWHSRAAPE